MQNKIYPINTWGIKQIGISEWLDSYYMPMTGHDFKKIYDYLFQLYLDSVVSQCNEEQDYLIAVATMGVLHPITTYLFEHLQTQMLREQDYTHLLGKKLTKIHEFTESPLYPMLAGRLENNWERYLKEWLRFGMNYSYSLRSAKQSVPLVGNPSQSEVGYYCAENSVFSLKVPTSFISVQRRVVEPPLLTLIDNFFQSICKAYPDLALDDLYHGMQIFYMKSIQHFKSSLPFLKNFKQTSILATGLGSIRHTLILAAWRSLGRSVIGFTHGNAFANSYEKVYLVGDSLFLINKQMVSSQGESSLRSQLLEDFSFGLETARIETYKQNMYVSLFEQLQKKQEDYNQIKTILLVGFPFTGYFSSSCPSLHTFAILQLEIKLAKLLRSAGYQVLYKAHPDRLAEATGLLDNYFDDFIAERFEDVYMIADCILFTHSHTTTFGFTMLTQKPIVLMNVDDNMWWPHAFELVSKRCAVVPATTNVGGEIIFDPQDVVDAIPYSLGQMDYEIVHQYAL